MIHDDRLDPTTLGDEDGDAMLRFHRMIACPWASLRFVMWRDEPQADGWQPIDKDDPNEQEMFAAIQEAIIARNPRDGDLDHAQFHAVLEEIRAAFPQVRVTDVASRIGQVSMTFKRVSRQGHALTAASADQRFHRAITTARPETPTRRYGAARSSSHRRAPGRRSRIARNKSPARRGDDLPPEPDDLAEVVGMLAAAVRELEFGGDGAEVALCLIAAACQALDEVGS